MGEIAESGALLDRFEDWARSLENAMSPERS
jgi:hypothetical protein